MTKTKTKTKTKNGKLDVNSYYGYVRVSSQSQECNSSIDSQSQELIKKGVREENIRVEIGSGEDPMEKRPIFYNLIQNELKKNDLLLITKMDRCSRNTLEFLKLQDILFKKSVNFICLDLPSSEDMAVNKLIATNLAAIATFETERRRERQKKGIEVAKKNKKYKGRKTVITPKLVAKVKDLKENKNLSVTEIAKLTGKGRTTIYKILKQELNYAPANKLIKKD
jgi:DNA invertase Pin-like site-specific DNA recombinase